MNYLHRAWAEIDLDALLHNFRIIKKSTDSKIFSVVKANAYGHSVYMIARLLDSEGTDFFAVSNIDEAKELRSYGIKKPILILGYTPPFLASELSENDITQAVFSLDYAKKLSDFAEKSGVTVSAHLKLDTGMGRIGFDLRTEELRGIGDAKKALLLSGISFDGIFTHFPSADSYDRADSDFTKEQFLRFKKAIDLLENEGFSFEVKHCCNSAATLLYPEMHLDAVRPGNILYGLTPSTDIEIGSEFKAVMTFKAAVSMVKTVNESETISYGRTFTAEKPMKIATVTAGYADGFPRLLSGKGEVLIHGKRAPIVGRICMDQFCCDVTDIENVAEGDTVVLFGKGLPVEEVAGWAGTINYEIVCGLSKRVPRVYIKDGKELDI
ncbi:MAG: alanine racemase [Clostridia bacterium]|nr:alanine racemase [Clostridia bacterium]